MEDLSPGSSRSHILSLSSSYRSRILWDPMDCHGFQWYPMGPCGSQWIPMDPSGFCVLQGFLGPETLDFTHLNTLFLRRSVYFVILGNFLERYRGRKCVQRSKPCFTMQTQRFLGSANRARKCENDDFRAFEHTFLRKKCVEVHFLEFWTEPA